MDQWTDRMMLHMHTQPALPYASCIQRYKIHAVYDYQCVQIVSFLKILTLLLHANVHKTIKQYEPLSPHSKVILSFLPS